MRPFCFAALLACLSLWGGAVRAQSARGTVQASVTIVDPVRAALDAAGASARVVDGGWQLDAPLSVAGAGSPRLSVQVEGRAAHCRALPAAGGARSGWLRCLVPRGASLAGRVTPIPVTLVLSSAT
jgi:hypothetical protein